MITPDQTIAAVAWTVPTAVFALWYYLSAPMAAHLAPRVPSLAPTAFASVARKFTGGVLFALLWLVMRLRFASAADPPAPFENIALLPAGTLLTSAAVAAGVSVVLAAFVGISSRSPKMHLLYPEFRQPSATPAQRVLSASSWMVYLAGYELLFRGIILGVAIASLGISAGIAAHTALYVLAHLHKPAGETLSCFLMGPLFAWLAMEHGIASAWLVHCAVAITGEQVSGTTNPQTLWKLRQ